MSKRLLALNFLLVAIGFLFLFQLVRILSAPRPLPPSSVVQAARAVADPKDEPTPALPSLAAFDVVASRTLFNPSRSEGPSTALLAPIAKPFLYGVVINGDARLAYLEDPLTKRVFGYKIGDPVAGGQLEEIREDRVTIRRPEGVFEVMLNDPSKPKAVASVPQPQAGATAQPPGAQEAQQRPVAPRSLAPPRALRPPPGVAVQVPAPVPEVQSAEPQGGSKRLKPPKTPRAPRQPRPPREGAPAAGDN